MSGQPAGSVYHPVHGDAIAADALARRDLVRRLQDGAARFNSEGDKKLPEGKWAAADRCWRIAARYQRAAQAIGGAKMVNPEDHEIVAAAWLSVLEMRKEIQR